MKMVNRIKLVCVKKLRNRVYDRFEVRVKPEDEEVVKKKYENMGYLVR